MLLEINHVEVVGTVVIGVAADHRGVLKLDKVRFDVATGDGVLVVGPDGTTNDFWIVLGATLVVGVGPQPDEGPPGGQRQRGDGLRGERLRFDRSDAGHHRTAERTLNCGRSARIAARSASSARYSIANGSSRISSAAGHQAARWR